jgi:hypothetical protein
MARPMAPSGHSRINYPSLTFCHRTLGCSVPSVLHFDTKNNVLLHSYQGRLTDTLLVEGYVHAHKYVASHAPSRIITDFSGVTSVEVSSHTVRTLAATPPKLPVGFERVFVVPQNALYGVARMFQILVENNRPALTIVRSMEEAHKLLGIKSAEFTPIDSQDFAEDQPA